jgi:hypothetical protein
MAPVYVAGAVPPDLYQGSLSFNPLTGSFVIGALRQADFGASGDAILSYGGVDMTLVGRSSENPSSWHLTVERLGGQATGAKVLDDDGTNTERGYLAASFSGVDEPNPIVGSPVVVNRNGGTQSFVEVPFGTLSADDMAVLIWALAAGGGGAPATVTGGTKGVELAVSDGSTAVGIAYQVGGGSVTLRADNGIFGAGVALGFVLRGTVAGATQRSHSGSLTPTGDHPAITIGVNGLDGVVTPTGTHSTNIIGGAPTQRSHGGTLTPTGAHTWQGSGGADQRTHTGALTATGTATGQPLPPPPVGGGLTLFTPRRD